MIFQNLHKKKVLIAALLLLTAFIYLVSVLFQNRQTVFKPFEAKFYTEKFEKSQWRVPNSKNPISDEDLYTYSGYKYIQGENPILVSPEVPPFGKYLVGWCIAIFGNQRIVSLLAGLGCLVLIFILTHKATSSVVAGSIAVFLTSINTLFIDQFLHSPQLEVLQLFFLLLLSLMMVYFYSTKKILFLVLAGVFFGLFTSIKVFLLSYLLINAWLLLFHLLKRESIKGTVINIITLNIVALITYTATYIQYFLYGNSLRDFLGVQKWIYAFYSNSNIDMKQLIGNYLSLLFFNKWKFWSAGYPVVQYENWSIMWPVIFILGVVSIFAIMKQKIKNYIPVYLMLSFFIIYNLFLLAVPIFPRYLVLLFIPLHICIAVYISKYFKA